MRLPGDADVTGPEVSRFFTMRPETYADHTPVSREFFDDPEFAHLRASIIRDAIERATLRIETEVYKADLPAGREVIPFEVSVPYHVTVPVPVERSWWARLLRRKPDLRQEQIAGTVTATGSVVVDLRATFRFPEFHPRTGPGIPRGAIVVEETTRVHDVDHYPTVGTQAAVSRSAMRCRWCGHYWSSHIPHSDATDDGDGGCLTTDCDCRNEPPTTRGGAQWI